MLIFILLSLTGVLRITYYQGHLILTRLGCITRVLFNHIHLNIGSPGTHILFLCHRQATSGLEYTQHLLVSQAGNCSFLHQLILH